MRENNIPHFGLLNKSYKVALVFFFMVIMASGQESKCKQILELSAKNSSFKSPVFACADDDGNDFFKAEITTDVCKDSLCELMEINVIWDLAGNYKTMDTIPGVPLTKNDHEPFSNSDYNKLHNILKNGNSILGYRTKIELIDNSVSDYSEKVDGVSGATSKEIKSTVVEGAVYSTYTLWHLVNGGIVNQLRKHTQTNYNPAIQNQLLESENPKTLLFVLKTFNAEDYIDHFEKVISIMKLNIPVINFYIAKKIPKTLFSKEENVIALQNIWDNLDKNTQSVLSVNMDPSE